jgi:hypothetical protein
MFNLNSIQHKIIVPQNTNSQISIDDVNHIQNQRIHFAIGDIGVISPDQVDNLSNQVGGNNKNRYYINYKKEKITTNKKSKKSAIEDLTKKVFKLQNKNYIKFILYDKLLKKKENYIVYKSKTNGKTRYQIKLN